MLDVFADITLALVIGLGAIAIVGVLALAEWTSPKSLRHPEGRRGRIRDDLIVLAPMAPFLAMVLTGAFQPDLREQAWWTAAMFSAAGIGLIAQLLPIVRRARQRVSALHRYPSQ